MSDKKFCYYINPTQNPGDHGGYVPSLVVENEPGHTPMTGRGDHALPWVWGQTLGDAEYVCVTMNAEMGHDQHEAALIVASSMNA